MNFMPRSEKPWKLVHYSSSSMTVHRISSTCNNGTKLETIRVFTNWSRRYLKSKTIEAPIDGLMYYFPDVTPKDGIYVVDTSDLFCALEGDVSEKRSLERTCQLIGIQPKGVHNAGNDAYVRLPLFYALYAIYLLWYTVYHDGPRRHGVW